MQLKNKKKEVSLTFPLFFCLFVVFFILFYFFKATAKGYQSNMNVWIKALYNRLITLCSAYLRLSLKKKERKANKQCLAKPFKQSELKVFISVDIRDFELIQPWTEIFYLAVHYFQKGFTFKLLIMPFKRHQNRN